MEGTRNKASRNVVLTGPGRSGTTLACNLLNKLPDVLALSEPISPGKFADVAHDQEAVVDGVENFYRRMRRMARRRGSVISKHVGGVVPDNSKGDVGGVRRRIAQKGKIPVTKDLTRDFQLVIKQPTMFTALLPALVKRLACYAVVRNPLPVLASVDGLREEHAARDDVPALRYDPILQGSLPDPGDPIAWHLGRLHLYFERYLALLPAQNIVRYEDIVLSGGKALSVVNASAESLEEPLASLNLNPAYDRKRMLEIGERLLASDGAYWHLYSKESVEELLGHFA